MRSAWGLSTPTDEAPTWRNFAACDPDTAEWFFGTEHRSEALALCRMCPVVERCVAETRAAKEEHRRNITAGGMWWDHNGQPRPPSRHMRDVPAVEGVMVLGKDCRRCRSHFTPPHPNSQYCGEQCRRLAVREVERRRYRRVP